MHFSSFGVTINSSLIASAITCHGISVFHTSEMVLKPFISRDSACNLADIIAVYKQAERFHIAGIEIKEWDKQVHQKLAAEYIETYRHNVRVLLSGGEKVLKENACPEGYRAFRFGKNEGNQESGISLSRC